MSRNLVLGSQSELDRACIAERKSWIATRLGLPAVGSKMVNAHGIEWVVAGHTEVPTAETLNRWRGGEFEPKHDLYPAVGPLNLSPKLAEFIAAVDRCTTKRFAILDTMPGRRNDGHVPGGNSIDTICDPEYNFLFLDAARVNETVIAHEMGHAWVQYVDLCEDFRTVEDASDPQRIRLVNFVQSYVLDLKVNDLIRSKGFDMRPIEEDQARCIGQLCNALASGYRPEHAREEVFMALLLADELVRHEQGRETALARIDDSLLLVRQHLPEMAGLSEGFASAVTRHGYANRDGIMSAIDECLIAAFEHCGEPIDLDSDLVEVNRPEPPVDKFPKWLPAISPRSKCQVGRHMARNDVSSDWAHSMELTITGRAKVTFLSPESPGRSEVVVNEQVGPPNRYSDLPESEAELMALRHRNETGGYLTHGGPPHTSSTEFERRIKKVTEMNEQNRQRAMGPALPPGFPTLPGRPYMAGTGRFLTAVREAEWVGGEHPYGYAENSPVTYVDPTGMAPRAKALQVKAPRIPSPSEMKRRGRDCSDAGRTPGYWKKCGYHNPDIHGPDCLNKAHAEAQTQLKQFNKRYSNPPGEVQNAFRHCVGSCIASRRCGCDWAKQIDIREGGLYYDPNKGGIGWREVGGWDELADLYNNRMGRILGDQPLTLSCTEACTQALESGVLRYLS